MRWLLRVFSIFAAVRGRLSTLAVVSLLAGLAWWGHRNDWTLPKFSELVAGPPAKEEPWCAEHGVPEAICIACNRKLMPKGKLYGWCERHGVHECPWEHPQVAQLEQVPRIDPAELARVRHALEHRPRKPNNPECKLHLRRIQFPSDEDARKAGIQVAPVQRGPVLEALEVVGEVRYDPTRVAQLASPAAGTVVLAGKNVGDRVARGELLALIDSAEVGRAKAQLLEALARVRLHEKTYRRLASIQAVVAGKRLLEAETALAQAQAQLEQAAQRLINLGLRVERKQLRSLSPQELAERLPLLGLPSHVTAQLDRTRATANLLPVVAPLDGVVVQRSVVAGEVVDPRRVLFTVADTRRMWLVLDVPQEEVRYVREGQQVLFRPDGSDHDEVGQVSWISTTVDTTTRTVQVRVELDNPRGHLRNETFGTGRIVLRRDPRAILVPRTALHWEGCCHVVFVQDKNYHKPDAFKVFHTRSVRPGVTMGQQVEILAGLLPGEMVVIEGGAALRAELLKGNLGAG